MDSSTSVPLSQPNQYNHATNELIDNDGLIEPATVPNIGAGEAAVDSSKPKQSKGKRQRGNIVCKYYQTVGGCRAGPTCPFLHSDIHNEIGGSSGHEPSTSAHGNSTKSSGVDPSRFSASQPSRAARQCNAPNSSAGRVMSRPVPQAQVKDPRQFQVDQLSRRYSPLQKNLDNGVTELVFKLFPSDPDFPFELSALECILRVPAGYPSVPPTLRVTNPDMGRGYQINVESGFDAIVHRSPKSSLLQLFNALDRDLEKLLSAPKAETVKIVANPPPKKHEKNAKDTIPSTQRISSELPIHSNIEQIKAPVYTLEQLANAKAKRDADTRQLEARLGRLPNYTRSSDGLSYTVPLEPRRRQDLPAYMQTIKSVKLKVPERYNLEPCEIEIHGVKGIEVLAVQRSFKSYASQNPQVGLFAQINRLAQNIHLMAKDPVPNEKTIEPISIVKAAEPKGTSIEVDAKALRDKPHVIVIPRPPEWSHGGGSEEESSEESSSSEEEEENKTSGDESQEETSNSLPVGPERGILISFPQLELYGIELLELISLSLTIKCDRCKETADVSNIRNATDGVGSAIKHAVCKKCSNQMSVGYRMDLMHANCIRAGYLDLDGCTVVDMLPSSFIPTCSECSTPCVPVIAVRGDSTTCICRECHKRMSFKLPEIKFLQVSATAIRASQAPRRKKKENLGIKAGENLPNKGRCTHYKKSYRWFRFSCCSKVFPCDRCHDAVSDHLNEHANRMICGYCSREQNYRPEDCHFCHSSLIAKSGSGFWEGGLGTRDKVRMSRKDPRKYKRRGATAPAGGAR